MMLLDSESTQGLPLWKRHKSFYRRHLIHMTGEHVNFEHFEQKRKLCARCEEVKFIFPFSLFI